MGNSRDTINGVKIASPCSMSWEAMEGDERVRYCSGCRLDVYNLSAMDVEEAARLLTESTSDRLCVRLYRRRDGTVLTQDCPVGLRAAIRRRVGALAGSIGAVFGLLTGLLLRPPAHATMTAPLMGDIAPAVPSTPAPPRANPFTELGELPVLNNVPVPRMGRIAASKSTPPRPNPFRAQQCKLFATRDRE